MNHSVPSGWIARRPTRWSMPVSLQRRAPRAVRIVEAASHRAVPESGLGYQLYANGQYQLEICLQDHEEEPRSVSLVNHSIRCARERARPVVEEDQTRYRYDLRWGRDDDAARPPRCWWSRPESLILRIAYADGREDFEQTLPIVITPRRRWALGAFLSSAVLYGVIPWLSRTILDRGEDLPAAWSQVLEVMSRSTVWLGLMVLIAILWLTVVLSDRFQLWLHNRQLRRAICRDAQRYLQRVQANER